MKRLLLAASVLVLQGCAFKGGIPDAVTVNWLCRDAGGAKISVNGEWRRCYRDEYGNWTLVTPADQKTRKEQRASQQALIPEGYGLDNTPRPWDEYLRID